MHSADEATTVASSAATRPYPAALRVVHVSALVVVVASVLAGRFPFAWVFDSIQHRPQWSGLVLTWLLGTLAYVVLWKAAMRGVRAAEIFLIVLFALGALWAAFIGLVSVLQVLGAGEGNGVGGWSWSLRLVVALATLTGAFFLIRWQAGEGAGETTDKALGVKGTLAALGTGVVGMVLMAWTLALIAPPSATQAGAVAAAEREMSTSLDTNSVSQFQDSVASRVDVLAHDRTRDRWGQLEGVFKGQGYNNNVQWGEQVLYRDQIVCVARSVKEATVVVLPGYCPG
jgi:hypothetical protein